MFGDGSNRWIDGAVETIANPVDRISNPYDTVAGAADAATLNFDEGVGGLTSLFDGQPGNTAGPGQQEWRPLGGVVLGEGGGRLGLVLWTLVGLAVVFVLGQLFTVNVGDQTQ